MTDSLQDMTNQVFFAVFKEPTAHEDWQKHIEFARLQPYITGNDQADWVKAIAFFQSELGKNFLRHNNRKHPMCARLFNRARHQVLEIVRMARTLQYFKENDSINYPALLKKILSPKKTVLEGIPFLEIANAYIGRGFEVRIPIEKENQTNPDIELVCKKTGEQFYIEVSKLEESWDQKASQDSFDLLYDKVFHQYGMLYSCNLFDHFKKEEIWAVKYFMESLRQRALRSTDIIYHIDERLEIAVIHEDHYSKLEEWMRINDKRKFLNGKPLTFNEAGRIADRKLEKEARQFRGKGTGIIYIPVTALGFWFWNEEAAAEAFREKMRSYPETLGVVVYSDDLVNQEEPFVRKTETYYYSKKMVNELIPKYLFYVPNPGYKGNLSEIAHKMIRATFE
jgi:hypothetical protein